MPFRKFNAVIEDAKLVYDLRQSLGKQIVDMDILANTMKELDKTGDDQITFDQVESVLRTVNIQLDKMVMTRWMTAARTSGVTSCSTAKLVIILHKAANPVNQTQLKEGNILMYNIQYVIKKIIKVNYLV